MLGLFLAVVCCAFTPQYGTVHDFDFEFGAWKAQLTRLVHPLSGSKQWVSYAGTSVVHPMLGGREDVGELQVSGAGGNIDGMTIRLYDPQAKQWNVRWVNAEDGMITTPLTGGFTNGRGVFYGRDTLRGKPIVARFVFSDLRPNQFHFEQAFSPDGGKTWEVNWIATFTKA
jgi:hypothetical protein